MFLACSGSKDGGQLDDNVKSQQSVVDSADFFYARASEKEAKKDFQGAIEDYNKALEHANPDGSIYWGSINNRGLIKMSQFANYEGALEDFNQVLNIDTSQLPAAVFGTRLYAGYSNRGLVKAYLIDTIGACEDCTRSLKYVPDWTTEEEYSTIKKELEKFCK